MTFQDSLDDIQKAFSELRQTQKTEKEISEFVDVSKQISINKEKLMHTREDILKSGVINKFYDYIKNKLENDKSVQDQIQMFINRTKNDSCIDLIIKTGTVMKSGEIIGFFGFDANSTEKSKILDGYQYDNVVKMLYTLGRCEKLNKGKFINYCLEVLPIYKFYDKAFIRISVSPTFIYFI